MLPAGTRLAGTRVRHPRAGPPPCPSTSNCGSVRHRVELRDEDDAPRTVWAATDASACGETLDVSFARRAYYSDTVVVRTAAPWFEVLFRDPR